MRESGLTYTLAAGGYTATINPAGFAGSGWFSAPDGVLFSASINAAVMTRPGAHGSYMDAGWREGIAGSFTLYNMAATAALRQSQGDNMMTVLDAMMGDDNGSGTLSWTPQDGSAGRQISGLQLLQPPTWSTVAGTLKTVSFVVQAEKPYAESSSSTNYDTATMGATGGGFAVPLTIPVTFTPGGAGTIDVVNSGSVDAYPTIQVYGPATGFTVTNSTTGLRLAFPSGSIASGDYLSIDLFQRTITQGATTTSLISALDLSQSSWFGFTPGTNTLQLTASGYDTSITKARIVMRSSYI